MSTLRILFLTLTILVVITSSFGYTYRAAVVEYEFQKSTLDRRERINRNVQNYVNLMQSAKQRNADIIIFPESILNNPYVASRAKNAEFAVLMPNPSEAISPCDYGDKYDETMKLISCEARSQNMYAVLHMLEKSKCTNYDCTSDLIDLYNTNIVFDRKGRVISRSRQLFDGRTFNASMNTNIDYNATLGSIINLENEKNEIVPLRLNSKIPFLTGTNTQDLHDGPENLEVHDLNLNIDEKGFFKYMFEKLQILLIIIGVYILEMM